MDILTLLYQGLLLRQNKVEYIKKVRKERSSKVIVDQSLAFSAPKKTPLRAHRRTKRQPVSDENIQANIDYLKKRYDDLTNKIRNLDQCLAFALERFRVNLVEVGNFVDGFVVEQIEREKEREWSMLVYGDRHHRFPFLT